MCILDKRKGEWILKASSVLYVQLKGCIRNIEDENKVEGRE